MKKTTWIIIFAIVAIMGILLVTCPSEAQHKDALISNISGAINQKIGEEFANEENGALAALFGGTISNYAIKLIINSNVRVEDHFIFSIGKMFWDGEESVCSIGCFGHVFCTSTEDLKRALDE